MTGIRATPVPCDLAALVELALLVTVSNKQTVGYAFLLIETLTKRLK